MGATKTNKDGGGKSKRVLEEGVCKNTRAEAV